MCNVLYRRNTISEISHHFLGQSKVTETVKVIIHTRRDCSFSSTLSSEPVSVESSRLTLPFRRVPLIDNALRMKTPLTYVHTFDEHVQLHVDSCTRKHFYHSLFSFSLLRSVVSGVCRVWDTVSIRICGPVLSHDRDVADMTILELKSHGFAIVYHYRSATQRPKHAQY